MRVFFSTGEPSGEYQAVELAKAMQGLAPEPLQLEGVGADRMRAAGFAVRVDTTGWASLGWLEAIGKIPRLLAIMVWTALRLRLDPPELIVLVDFGAFNLRLARQLRRTGYRGPIVYYIPPGAWLDRAAQARKVAAATRPLTVFAHQRDFYAGLGLECAFFGHPLGSLVAPRAPRPAPPPDGGTLALLPGSRTAEIERHMVPLLSAAQALALQRPKLELFIGAASPALAARIQTHLERFGAMRAHVVAGAKAALENADAAWIASGTAVLEAALMGVPSVLLYVTSEAQAKMARRMYAKIGGRYLGLPNLVLGRGVIPEFWQEEATGSALAEAMRTILLDPAAQLAELGGLRKALGAADALERCARFVLDAAAR
ncbi:MAG: hypothetical protein JO140_02730 [Candidatus Eremiobacteraeota bacterium]|nr:hypothetical protein [Candidatus Eremiobacteraeota bacterium]